MRIAAAVDSSADARWFRAPGRVNLMGDHTDYNEGFVLPAAIDRECVVAAVPASHGRIRIRSLDAGGEDAIDLAADGSDDPRRVSPSWGRYVAGVARALAERGRPSIGIDAVLGSTIPAGAGLASSAALEVSCALALLDSADAALAPSEAAIVCQRGEHLATGVPSGIVDQLASLSGREGHALFVDCRSLEATAVSLPARLTIVVVHSGVSRTLAETPYAERRAACERIAAELGLHTLRDATLDDVRRFPLAHHVVSENERVRRTAAALVADDLDAVSELFAASHASLRDDYRVSTRELDALVEALADAGAVGARLTGAGFGGAVVALCAREDAERVAARAGERYRDATGFEATAFLCRAVGRAQGFEPTLPPSAGASMSRAGKQSRE